MAFPFATSSPFPAYQQQQQLRMPSQQLQLQTQMLSQQRQALAIPPFPTLLQQTPMLMQQMLQPTLLQNQMQMQLMQQQQQLHQQQMQMQQKMQQQILYNSQVSQRPGQWQSLVPPPLLPSPPQPQQQLLQPLQQWLPRRQESSQDLPASFFFDSRPAQLQADAMRQLQSLPSAASPAVAALGLQDDRGFSVPVRMQDTGATAEPTSNAALARIPAKKKLLQVQASSAAQPADPRAVATEKRGRIKARASTLGAAASEACSRGPGRASREENAGHDEGLPGAEEAPTEVDATTQAREAREAGTAGESIKGPEGSQKSAKRKRRRSLGGSQPGEVCDFPSNFGLVAIKQLPAITTLRELRAACDGSQGLIACSFDPQLTSSDGFFRSAHAVYDTAARARKASRRLDLVWANPARANRVFANTAIASRVIASDRGIAHPEDERRRRTGPRLVPRRRHEHATDAASDDGMPVPDDDADEADAAATAGGELEENGGGETTEERDAGVVDASDVPAADAPTADSSHSESLGASSVRLRKRRRSSHKSRAQVEPDEAEGEGESALLDERGLLCETTTAAEFVAAGQMTHG